MNVKNVLRTRITSSKMLTKKQQQKNLKHTIINKGNNKITELRTILQRESQNS